MLCFTERDFAPEWKYWGHFLTPLDPAEGCNPSLSSSSSQNSFQSCCRFSFPCAWVILFFSLIKSKLKFAKMSFGECHLLGPDCVCSCACLGAGGGGEAVCMRLAMQGAGPRLMPPSATVKVVPRTQLAIKMPDAGAPLMLVLHVKLHKTRCLFLLLCKLFFFFF